MYEEIRNCNLNGFDRDLLIGFFCYPGWMCVPSLMGVGIGTLELLNRNGFDTFDPCNLGYRQTYRQTDMCKTICSLFFEGGHKKSW